MRHPTEGVLRRLLDEPAGVPDTDREHVAGCTACLDALAGARADAARAARALAVGVHVDADGAPTVDVDAAWRRLPRRSPRPRHLALRVPGGSREGDRSVRDGVGEGPAVRHEDQRAAPCELPRLDRRAQAAGRRDGRRRQRAVRA